MSGNASRPVTEVTRVATGLRQVIACGVIPPGERIRVGSPGWPYGLSGTRARSALAIVRRQGLAHWHRHEYYAAPAGSPQPTVSTRPGQVLAGARAAAGVTVSGLAARIADGTGPWGPGGREHMIGLRITGITVAGTGTWQPRRAWEHIDAAMGAGGTLLRVHDTLYACHASPAGRDSRTRRTVMTATSCTCGFQRLDDEELADHLMAAFDPDDSAGGDGHVHHELAGLACSCGFAATTTQDLDSHFLAMFTPAGSVGRDGVKHEPAT